MKHTKHRSGFTLVEIAAASAVLIIAVAMALSGLVYALRDSKRANLQNELDMDVQKSMEELKANLRLSSLDEMFYHPIGSGTYTAISFPLAYAGTSGAITLDASNRVVWDETRIFHVWRSAPNQLRLTTFRPRNTNRTDAEMLEQLTYVATNGYATNGTGGGTHDYSNAQTKVIFQNLFDWSVTPQSSTYDGYAVQTQRDVAVNLGSCILSNGPHVLTFTVIGKNPSSSGYKVGLDTLSVSPAGLEREAEEQRVTATNGPDLLRPYMGGGSWDHNYQLYFPAVATGQSFSIALTNDTWEEVNFRGTSQQMDDTTVTWDMPPCPTPATTDYVVRLDGVLGDGWYAKKQTGCEESYSNGVNDLGDTLRGSAVRVLVKGSQMEYGGFIQQNSKRSYVMFTGAASLLGLKLRVLEAYISDCANSTSAVPDAPSSGPFHRLTSLSGPTWEIGGSGGDNWTLTYCNVCAAGLHLIEKTNSYIVSFLVDNNPWKGCARYWPETNDPLGRGCWILPGASSADLQTPTWSTNTNVVVAAGVYAIEKLWLGYPTNGFFASTIMDTHKTAVSNVVVAWTADVPPGCSFALKVRAGNDGNSLSDAPEWTDVSAVTSGATTNLGAARYVQWQAMLGANNVCDLTPKLHGVTLCWAGETRYVDVSGAFTQGPDYGIWRMDIDGQTLTRGLSVDLEIYEDISSGLAKRRITSALTSEVRPRNTGK